MIRTFASVSLFALIVFVMSSAAGATPDSRKWKSAHRVDCPSFPVGCSGTADMFSPQIAVDTAGNGVAVWQIVDQGVAHLRASRYNSSTLRWEDAVAVDGTTGGASDAQVAMDAGGNAMVVWTQADGVQARRRAANGTLGNITSLQAIAGHGSVPQVAVLPNGDAIVVWHQSDGTHKRIWARRYTASMNQWEPTARTLDANTADASLAQVAADNMRGNVLVVWQQGATQIGANRYSAADQQWVGAVTIPSASTTASAPQLAVDSRGIGRAVWVGFDTNANRNRVWSSRFVDQWEAAVPVEPNTGPVATGDAISPQIAVDGNSNAVIVWTQFDGAHNNVWSSRYVASRGQWDEAVLIESIDGEASSPSIAMDPSGNAQAGWQQAQPNASISSVWGARYTPTPGATLAQSWAPAKLLEHDDHGSAFVPRLAFDRQGVGTAVWYQSDGTHFGIRFNRYDVGRWTEPTLIEGAAGAAIGGDIAFDRNGNATAVWYDWHDGNVWANRYLPDLGWSGAAVIGPGIDFTPATPRIAFDANGNAIAMWSAMTGSATFKRIYSNRFADGQWGTAVPLTSEATGSVAMALNASGNALAVWPGKAAPPSFFGSSIWWSQENSTHVWGPIKPLGGFVASNPQLTFDASGNALATWADMFDTFGMGHSQFTPNKWGIVSILNDAIGSVAVGSGGDAFVFLNKFSNQILVSHYTAGAWGTPEQIDSGTGGSAVDAQTVVDANGNVTALWSKNEPISSPTTYGIWANRRTGGQWGTAQRVEPTARTTSNNSGPHPRLTVDPRGDVFAVWGQSDGINEKIWSNWYTLDGGWQSSPIALNPNHTGLAMEPAVAVDADGNALAIWRECNTPASCTTWHAWASLYE
jgi:hypothetical protein